VRDRFLFSVAGFPDYIHYAEVHGQSVFISWDDGYLENVIGFSGRSKTPYTPTVAEVENWIEEDGWIVLSTSPPRTQLRCKLAQLQLGFEALEEGFQSLRSEFERLKR